jgi:hypothetical protein
MRKRLVIVALLMTIAPAFSPVLGQATSSCAPKGQKQNDIHNKRPSPKLSPVAGQDNGIAIQESKERPADDDHSAVNVINPDSMPESWSWHDKVAWGAGLLLLVVAAVTLWWFIVQTIATKKAAEAALLNAQALVNSERPWLIAEVEKDSVMPHFYHLRITNYGRTPARFLSGDASHTIVERPDLLPIPPSYPSPIVLPTQLLIAPNKGFLVPHGYSISHLLQMPDAVNKVLVIYGRVLYEDMIVTGVEHETRWCFGYVQTSRGYIAEYEFVQAGPNEYTKNS